MSYRKIDAQGIWQGDAQALEVFARAYAIDCGGCDETWRKVYGWSQGALDQAKERAFGPAYQGMSGIEC